MTITDVLVPDSFTDNKEAKNENQSSRCVESRRAINH